MTGASPQSRTTSGKSHCQPPFAAFVRKSQTLLVFRNFRPESRNNLRSTRSLSGTVQFRPDLVDSGRKARKSYGIAQVRSTIGNSGRQFEFAFGKRQVPVRCRQFRAVISDACRLSELPTGLGQVLSEIPTSDRKASMTSNNPHVRPANLKNVQQFTVNERK